MARRPLRPALAVGAGAILLLAACGSGTTSGSGASGSTPSDGGTLAERWRDAISISAIRDDLATLQAIADAHGGTRAAGTSGYDASASFVAQTMRRLGYRVTLDTFEIPLFSEVGTSELSVAGGPALRAATDFRAMLFSPSGDLTAKVAAVGYNRKADATAFLSKPTGSGCQASDYPASVRGAIVLVQPGPCFRRTQAQSAQQAGAAAIVVAYPQWEPGFVLRPTLLSPEGLQVPVIGATREAGDALADAAEAGESVHLRVQTAIVNRAVSNVIAELPGSDATVVALGGHLDTALEGPGVNDDGSGVATLLELARRLVTFGTPRHTVRFGFWAAEELGLFGSRHYVEGLTDAERSRIEAYLNYDMLGSANGDRLVYADAGDPSGSKRLTALFGDYFRQAGLSSEELDLSGASDHYSFAQAGIPTGGLFSGANELKTDADAKAFGGTAGKLYDECYHRACDRADRIDWQLLEQLARAAADVTGQLVSGAASITG